METWLLISSAPLPDRRLLKQGTQDSSNWHVFDFSKLKELNLDTVLKALCSSFPLMSPLRATAFYSTFFIEVKIYIH
jgi:hypothetical protein